jgi:hypothetical protein
MCWHRLSNYFIEFSSECRKGHCRKPRSPLTERFVDDGGSGTPLHGILSWFYSTELHSHLLLEQTILPNGDHVLLMSVFWPGSWLKSIPAKDFKWLERWTSRIIMHSGLWGTAPIYTCHSALVKGSAFHYCKSLDLDNLLHGNHVVGKWSTDSGPHQKPHATMRQLSRALSAGSTAYLRIMARLLASLLD